MTPNMPIPLTLNIIIAHLPLTAHLCVSLFILDICLQRMIRQLKYKEIVE